RLAERRHARVVEARDPRVLETREDPLFLAYVPQRWGVHDRVDDFQRDGAGEVRALLVREIHRRAAAAADPAMQAVARDDRDRRVVEAGDQRSVERLRDVRMREKRAQLLPERRIGFGRARDLRLTLAGGHLGDAVEELAQALEVSRRPDGELVHTLSRSLWRSQARAKAQSRFAVRGEQPRSAATSSMLRPPKKRSSMTRESRGSS